MSNLEKIFTVQNIGGPKVYAWDNERSEFVRQDSTITVNWGKLTSLLIVQPMRSVIGCVTKYKYQMLLVGVGGLGVYGLYQQKKLILLFVGKIKYLEEKILSGAIKFDSLENLYDEVLSMAQNAIKQLHLAEKLEHLNSLEIRMIKTELLQSHQALLEVNKLSYFQEQALKICEQQNSSSKFPHSKALEYLHKVADSEAQKSERISKLMAKLIRQQQGRIR